MFTVARNNAYCVVTVRTRVQASDGKRWIPPTNDDRGVALGEWMVGAN